ncbi:Hypothetical protein Eab7_2293 [Exiguobacterium antarcticum B7]|nr:Hypothetical protein Eab7_2293 [Exiguobacterium antarcticum B7]
MSLPSGTGKTRSSEKDDREGSGTGKTRSSEKDDRGLRSARGKRANGRTETLSCYLRKTQGLVLVST